MSFSISKLKYGLFFLDGLDGLHKDISSDYLQYGEFVPLNSVSNFKKGDQLQVLVCEVNSPAQFWLHIESNVTSLDKMMTDMNAQYEEDDAGALPSSMLPVRGLQFCTVKHDGIWYRAVVIGQPTSDGDIMIRRVDFGIMELVPIKELRPLRREWASLPMQAIRSQLTKLLPGRPGEDEWSPEQSAAFSDMVFGGPLIATVTAVDTTVNALHLYLLDPVTRRYINCELVKQLASHVDNSVSSNKFYLP